MQARACQLQGITNDESIRVRYHVLYWIKTLHRAKKLGGDPKTILDKYEKTESVSADSRLAGKKRWVVENLLQKGSPGFIREALEELDVKGSLEKSGSRTCMHACLAFSSAHDHCHEHDLCIVHAPPSSSLPHAFNVPCIPVFTDSNLATKSLLTGYAPAITPPNWAEMCRNTETSLEWCAQAWRKEELVTKKGVPRKRDPKEVPELAEFCAWGEKFVKDCEAANMYDEKVITGVKEAVVNLNSLLN